LAVQRHILASAALAVVATAHGVLAWTFKDQRPDFAVLPPPPSGVEREALSFGDRQFLYRMWSLNIQNAGDTGGRATPMRDYNYEHVIGWLKALHALDPRGQHHMFLATWYFSQTPNEVDVRRIVDFVVEASAQKPEQSWYWMARAVTLAEMRVADADYALGIARRLAAYEFPDMPAWILMYPAILLEMSGRIADADLAAREVFERRQGTFSPEDLAWAREFLQRLSMVR